MKFLVDNQLPRALVRRLRELGLDADHVADFGMDESTDREIWQAAAAQGSAIISKDADFLHLAIQDPHGPAFIWVRLGNCRTPALLAAFDWRMEEILNALKAGRKIIEIV